MAALFIGEVMLHECIILLCDIISFLSFVIRF